MPIAQTEHWDQTSEGVVHRDYPGRADAGRASAVVVVVAVDAGNVVDRTASVGSSPGLVGRGRRSSGSCPPYATAGRAAAGGRSCRVVGRMRWATGFVV